MGNNTMENVLEEVFNDYSVITVIEKSLPANKLKVGKAIMKPGARIPEDGTASHAGEEISYVVRGRVSIYTDDGQISDLARGDMSLLPKDKAHWSVNEGDTECELFWVLVE